MSGFDTWLGGLRRRALQTIGDNAVVLGQSGIQTDPAKQWWNIPAKYAAARQIEKEERAKFTDHHNDAGDAMRHAEWAQRTAAAAGPIFTTVAGFGHELENTLPTGWAPDAHGQHAPERNMDLHNNAEGIRAAVEGRPIGPASLQLGPVYPDGRPPDPYGGAYGRR
jgi:hypothetical protein